MNKMVSGRFREETSEFEQKKYRLDGRFSTNGILCRNFHDSIPAER